MNSFLIEADFGWLNPGARYTFPLHAQRHQTDAPDFRRIDIVSI